MRKHSRTTAYRDESRLFYSALTALMVVICLYIYFVSSSVASVVMRKEADANISELSTKVSELEAEYIEKQHSVSNDIAVQKGFVAADAKIFIDTTGDTLVLSKN
jgi:hypothetical protein